MQPMQRTGGMRGFAGGRGRVVVGGGGGGSVKNRLGLPANGRRGGVIKGGIQRRVGGGLAVGVVGGGGGVKSRLGPGAVLRAKRSVASVALGEILDARQKINFNRVQSGRIGDARQKIEEKRHNKSVMDGKLRNLKIIAPAADSLGRSPMMRQQAGGLVSRSERDAMNYQGVFRSAMEDTFGYPVQAQRTSMPQSMGGLTRTIGGGSYHPAGVRIAPPSEDNFMLTRTIRNPVAVSNYGREYSTGRSPLQRKMEPSMQQYSSHQSHGHGGGVSYNSRSALRDQPMDEDDYDHPVPTRRSDYSSSASESLCRILVSNLQPSVTADDIVELFSDIGPLSGARMTSSGQAEVTYSRKADALKAIEAYHNRLLDGSAMRVFLDTASTSRPSTADSGSYTALRSASGASMKLPAPKTSSGIKIQPDVSAIHKVLFNPGSSVTRGLFKGNQ